MQVSLPGSRALNQGCWGPPAGLGLDGSSGSPALCFTSRMCLYFGYHETRSFVISDVLQLHAHPPTPPEGWCSFRGASRLLVTPGLFYSSQSSISPRAYFSAQTPRASRRNHPTPQAWPQPREGEAACFQCCRRRAPLSSSVRRWDGPLGPTPRQHASHARNARSVRHPPGHSRGRPRASLSPGYRRPRTRSVTRSPPSTQNQAA